jgi:hypothetical protein
MDSNLDLEELEKEQLDYLRRNYDKTMNIPNSVDMNLDILEKPIDDRIILSPEQEKILLKEVMNKQMENQREVTVKRKFNDFSLSVYFDILAESFIGIMDDLLNFEGDIESLPGILSKDDRLVLFGTIIFALSLAMLFSKNRA